MQKNTNYYSYCLKYTITLHYVLKHKHFDFLKNTLQINIYIKDASAVRRHFKTFKYQDNDKYVFENLSALKVSFWIF